MDMRVLPAYYLVFGTEAIFLVLTTIALALHRTVVRSSVLQPRHNGRWTIVKDDFT